MKYEFSFFKSSLLLPLLLSLSLLATSKPHGNPANEIVNILNQNRTARKLTKLKDSPGLGCVALQYAEFCEGHCNVDSNDALTCEPPEDDYTQVFAPNCGVELPTFGTITGHIVGCKSRYAQPEVAFSDVLFKNDKALLVLRNRSHTEVGVGMARLHKDTFFWCVLFSNGVMNSTFVLEDNGRGIKQRKGCYSGSAFPCSNGHVICNSMPLLNSFLGIAFSSFCLFGYYLSTSHCAP